MKAACSEEVPNRTKCERGSAADCQSRVARANPCLAGRGHRLAGGRTVCSEIAGYQLPIKRDQRHTVDRVSGSWTVQDRGVPETDSARCLPSGSAEEVA